MIRRIRSKCLLPLIVLFLADIGATRAASEIQVNGLFADRAVLTINGKRRFLKAGQPAQDGVRLVSASSEKAVIEVDGKRRVVRLSTTIGSSYSAPEKRQVSIARDQRNAYVVSGKINGRAIKMLVDTGASHIAMNSAHAEQLGIDYRRDGTVAGMATASGLVEAYYLTLAKVSVAGITVRNVKASVSEGAFPAEVLLGMSYLKHVKIEEKAGLLYLSEKH